VRAFIHNALLNVAHWLGKRGHDSASARLYAALAEYEHDDVRNAYLRYRALLQEERLEEALAHLDQAVAASAGSAGMLHEHGVLLQRLQRHADAVDAFDRALTLDAAQSECHSSRAFSLMQLGRWPEADAALRRALRHDDRNRLAWHDLGMTLAQLERFDEAIQAFRSAIEIAPDTATSVSLAFVLETFERFDEAETVLRDALRTDPSNALLVSTLAGVLVQQQRTADATRLLESADAKAPEHPAIVGAMVWALLGSGQNDDAVAAGSWPSSRARTHTPCSPGRTSNRAGSMRRPARSNRPSGRLDERHSRPSDAAISTEFTPPCCQPTAITRRRSRCSSGSAKQDRASS
jgi:Flp pilus assembly protein TadD